MTTTPKAAAEEVAEREAGARALGARVGEVAAAPTRLGALKW